MLFFGLPALDHFGSDLVAAEEVEPSAFQWFLAWWPDAIVDGRNPLVTDYIYAPDRVNMTWVTGVPGLALATAPVTLLFGPVASFNLITLAAPALAGLATFVLCRHLTGSFGPSLAGGYLFAFSPYMLVTLAGIPSHSFTALIPVAVYLVVRRVDGTLGKRWFTVLLAATLAGQFLVSVEVFALLTAFGLLIGFAAYALLHERRAALRGVLPQLGLAYLLAAVVLTPYLWYMLFEPYLEPVHAVPERHSSDLLSFFVPTSLQELGAGAFPTMEKKFGGAIPVTHGGGGYAHLGLPLIAIFVLFALERVRSRVRWLLLGSVAVLGLLSLGPRLFVAGENLAPMPEELMSELPFLQYAIPSRFPVYTALAAAVVLALWLATRPGWWKWVLTVVAFAFILPNFGSGLWSAKTNEPEFFREKLYQGVVREDDVVFMVPPVGDSQRWHAENGMPFRLAGGYVGRVPDDLTGFYGAVYSSGPLQQAPTRAFLARRRVNVILVAAPVRQHARWRRRLAFLGVEPRVRGDVLVYRLSRPRTS